MDTALELQERPVARDGATLATRFQHKYGDRITGSVSLPALAARLAPSPPDLPPALARHHAR